MVRKNQYRNELISEIKTLAQSNGLNTVFTTFLEITLQGAVAGNHDAFEKIIDLYAPLIEHHCYINGKYDEDLHQYILMRIALKISKFNI